MSEMNARKFFETLQKDPDSIASLMPKEKPETEEGLIAAYVEVAKKLNCEVTSEELKAAYEDICRAVAARTEADENSVQDISPEELDQVAGGLFGGDGDHSECKSTYKHRENCWFIDACDKAIYSYKGYWCAMASRIYCDQLSDEAP